MSSYLVPNSPRKRIAYIYKTMPKVADKTAMVCARIFGADEGRVVQSTDHWDADVISADVAVHFPDYWHEHEAIIPWVARQLNDLEKQVARDPKTEPLCESIADSIKSRLPRIAAWAAHSHVDLTRLTSMEAIARADEFVPEKDKIPQGAVVHRFADGWTIQELTTAEQLAAEGAAVQNCLDDTDWVTEIADGEVRIFSLRTDRGYPCVSIEFRLDEYNKSAHGGRFGQIYARQNTSLNATVEQIAGERDPWSAAALWSNIQKYKPRVQEFIRARFNGEPMGLLASGADARLIDFRKANLRGARFAYGTLGGAVFDRTDLRDARFVNVDVGGADFTKARLGGIDSRGLTGTACLLPPGWALVHGFLIGPTARVSGAMTDADLDGIDLRGVLMYGMTSGGITGTPLGMPTGWKLIRGFLVGPGARLENANLDDADLRRMDLTDTLMKGTRLNNADLSHAKLAYVNSSGIKGTPRSLPAEWRLINGSLVGPEAILAGVSLDNEDLSRMNLRGIQMSRVSMHGAILSDTVMSGANMRKVSLSEAVLHRTNLSDARLDDVSLTFADLTDAFLVKTRLRAVDLTGAVMTGTALSVFYDKSVKWPSGFRPPPPLRGKRRAKTSRVLR